MNKAATIFFLSTLLFSVSCNDDDSNKADDLVEVASSTKRWTGVAVSNTSRVFANFPNWSADHTYSVIEVTDSSNFQVYPSLNWNTWSSELDPSNHFICVQSVFVDRNNQLWVLDAANPQRDGEFLGVVAGGAKLVQIDLASDQVVNTFVFESPIVESNSYLNDVRIDEFNNFAFITDSNEGALILLNLATGQARRVLAEHPSTKSENRIIRVEGEEFRNAQGEYPVIHSDGIAITPDVRFLYWRPLTGESLYRIRTDILRNFSSTENSIEDAVEKLGEIPPSDGIIFGSDAELYITSIEENAIRRYNGGDDSEKVIASSALRWPDSFAVGPDGSIYVTTSILHVSQPTERFRIFKFRVD